MVEIMHHHQAGMTMMGWPQTETMVIWHCNFIVDCLVDCLLFRICYLLCCFVLFTDAPPRTKYDYTPPSLTRDYDSEYKISSFSDHFIINDDLDN